MPLPRRSPPSCSRRRRSRICGNRTLQTQGGCNDWRATSARRPAPESAPFGRVGPDTAPPDPPGHRTSTRTTTPPARCGVHHDCRDTGPWHARAARLLEPRLEGRNKRKNEMNSGSVDGARLLRAWLGVRVGRKDDGLVIHSLRHYFETCCVNSRVPQLVVDA